MENENRKIILNDKPYKLGKGLMRVLYARLMEVINDKDKVNQILKRINGFLMLKEEEINYFYLEIDLNNEKVTITIIPLEIKEKENKEVIEVRL